MVSANGGQGRPEKPDRPEKLRETLLRFNLKIRQEQELAEARLEDLNLQLRALHRSGLLGAVAVPGPMILCRPYPAGGPEDSGEYVQAVLALPEGFGAVYWDSEEAVQLLADESFFGREAGRRVVPFERCEPAIRALLAPHAAPMLAELLGRFRIGGAGA